MQLQYIISFNFQYFKLKLTTIQDSPSVVHINGDRLGGVRPSTGKTRTPSTKRRVVKRKKGKHSKSKSNVTYEPIVMRADMDKYESVPEVISHYVVRILFAPRPKRIRFNVINRPSAF